MSKTTVTFDIACTLTNSNLNPNMDSGLIYLDITKLSECPKIYRNR